MFNPTKYIAESSKNGIRAISITFTYAKTADQYSNIGSGLRVPNFALASIGNEYEQISVETTTCTLQQHSMNLNNTADVKAAKTSKYWRSTSKSLFRHFKDSSLSSNAITLKLSLVKQCYKYISKNICNETLWSQICKDTNMHVRKKQQLASTLQCWWHWMGSIITVLANSTNLHQTREECSFLSLQIYYTFLEGTL